MKRVVFVRRTSVSQFNALGRQRPQSVYSASSLRFSVPSDGCDGWGEGWSHEYLNDDGVSWWGAR